VAVSGMSNYFNLQLDTISPKIEIFAPRYIGKGEYMEFRVSSNEYIDIYKAKAVDNGKNDFTIILSRDGEEFTGLVQINGFESGIAKIVVDMYDEVHNKTTTEKAFLVLSNVIDKINITTRMFKSKINHQIIKQNVNYISSKHQVTYKCMNQNVKFNLRKNTMTFKKMKHSVFILKRNINITLKEGDTIAN
jgi:hypothetical protein